jgi:FkbM family methyltransferase
MELIQTKDIGLGSFIVIKNDLIGEFIINHGFWELHLFEIYKNLIEPNDVILDAGANIGFHTVQFAKLAKKVYAYEPQPLIFNLLSTNILMSGTTEVVEQFRLGIGDKNCKIKMQPLNRFNESNGWNNFGGRGLTTEDDGEEEIELIQFDKDIDVIKMDIQGSEIYALKGMEKVLDRCSPWFMIENYEGVENDEKVIEFLISKGYVIYRPTNILPNEDCIAFKPSLDKHKKIEKELNSEKYKIFKFIIHK